MQLGQLQQYVLIFIIAVVIIGIGGTILVEIQETQYFDVSVSNETVNFVSNDTYYQVANANVQTFTSVQNATYVIPTTNWAGVAANRSIKIMVNASMATGNYLVSYGYENRGTVASNATSSGLEGIETFGDWLPTIAVIIAAAVVIGIIVNYFRT